MNEFVGLIMVAASVGMLLYYRPRSRKGISLCALCTLSGILTMIQTSGGSVVLEWIKFLALTVLLVSGWLYVRRERMLLARRQARLRGCISKRRLSSLQKQPRDPRQIRVCA